MSEKLKSIVKDVNDAFTVNDMERFLNHCSEDVVWRMVGDTQKTGRESIREWMSQMEGGEPPKFTVEEMIAEGDSVICRGDMTMNGEDGAEGKYSYCDAYRFRGDKIVQLDSYIIKQQTEGEDQTAAGA
jgi:ketosteroid isomerase-like protein